MKVSDLNHAMQYIDDRYLDMAEAPEKEILNMSKNSMGTANRKIRRFKKPAVVFLAACFVLALGITAGATRLFGLTELWNNSNRTLSSDASGYIQAETVQAEGNGWDCEITESLSDATTAMVTVTIRGGDKYIVAPTDANPSDSVADIGLTGNQTLAEYAADQGKTLLFVGATIEQVGGQGGSQSFENISDSEMVILVQTSKTVSETALDAVCTVYARADGSSEVQKVSLPFTMTEAPADETVYQPLDPDSVSGLSAGNASIIQSPLGYSIDFPITVTDSEILERLARIEIEGLTYGTGGGLTLEEDEFWHFHADMCQGELGDTLTVQYYDIDTDELIGSMVFQRTSE